MSTFQTNKIFRAFNHDIEHTEYKILAQLKRSHTAFTEHRLFPCLDELQDLQEDLKAIKDNKLRIKKSLNRSADSHIKIVTALVEEGGIPPATLRAKLQRVVWLAEWALPKVADVLEPAEEKFTELVDQLEVELVDQASYYQRYLADGYLILATPEKTGARKFRVFSYQYRRHSASRQAIQASTESCSVPSEATAPDKLAADLLALRSKKEQARNPRPAVIFIDIPAPYSFEQTVLPAACQRLAEWFPRQRTAIRRYVDQDY